MTVSSSGSGITASSVTGRTFNYNYNNYQFNQPPSAPNSRHSIANQPGASPPNNSVVVDQARKHMSWRGRAPAAYAGHPANIKSKKMKGHLKRKWLLKRKMNIHRCHLPEVIVALNRTLIPLHRPFPPAVLVLQTPSHRKGDYRPSYAYEYSLKHDRDIDDAIHTLKGREGAVAILEKKKVKMRIRVRRARKVKIYRRLKRKLEDKEWREEEREGQGVKVKNKVGKPKEKQKKSKSRELRDEEDESEEDESDEDEEGKEDEEAKTKTKNHHRIMKLGRNPRSEQLKHASQRRRRRKCLFSSHQ
ncbi:hypothetical protein JOM56_000571 [Amanita muscaria]